MHKMLATRQKNTIDEENCDHENFYRYDAGMTMAEAIEFLHAIDVFDEPAAPLKRPNPANSRQKMPAAVANCSKNCNQTRPLERDGGIRQLLAIGWLVAGETCILHVPNACSVVGVIDANGTLKPHDKQHMSFREPVQWLAHEGVEADTSTNGYRFVLFPAFRNASLYQIAAIYAHSSKCTGIRYTHEKTSHPADNYMLSRRDLSKMFESEIPLNVEYAGRVEHELRQEIDRLNMKLAAYHKFFMELKIV